MGGCLTQQNNQNEQLLKRVQELEKQLKAQQINGQSKEGVQQNQKPQECGQNINPLEPQKNNQQTQNQLESKEGVQQNQKTLECGQNINPLEPQKINQQTQNQLDTEILQAFKQQQDLIYQMIQSQQQEQIETRKILQELQNNQQTTRKDSQKIYTQTEDSIDVNCPPLIKYENESVSQPQNQQNQPYAQYPVNQVQISQSQVQMSSYQQQNPSNLSQPWTVQNQAQMPQQSSQYPQSQNQNAYNQTQVLQQNQQNYNNQDQPIQQDNQPFWQGIIYAKTFQSKRFDVNVKSTDKVQEIRKYINSMSTELADCGFKLFFKGQDLDDNRTISSYGIKKEDSLHIAQNVKQQTLQKYLDQIAKINQIILILKLYFFSLLHQPGCFYYLNIIYLESFLNQVLSIQIQKIRFKKESYPPKSVPNKFKNFGRLKMLGKTTKTKKKGVRWCLNHKNAPFTIHLKQSIESA